MAPRRSATGWTPVLIFWEKRCSSWVPILANCTTLHHTASHCITLKPCDTTSHCNALHHTATIASHCITLQHAATHNITLHHTASHRITLHYTASHCITLQHTASHCITLHHTASHCNTLHYTASQCNTRHGTARSVEDETRNAELNGNRNPEWRGDFSLTADLN